MKYPERQNANWRWFGDEETRNLCLIADFCGDENV
jgi:hypothetical protein